MQEEDPKFNPIRLIPVFMGFIFAGIGITVLIFVWGAPSGGFGSPPLFFRVFASFIALSFVVVGGGSALAALKFKSPLNQMTNHLHSLKTPNHTTANETANRYACPKCGASLNSDADISPSGDVKCSYCDSWFNTRA